METSDRVVTATLRWVSPQRGARIAPPSNPTYRAVSRFAVDPNASLGLWDAVVTFSRLPGPHAKTSTVKMAFVSADAPKPLLRRERTASSIEIEVYTHNHAALRLYNSAGFIPHGDPVPELRHDGQQWTIQRLRYDLSTKQR
jgi:hypothetical protein